MVRVRRGEIWLIRFPFTDFSSSKLRPALVIAEHGDDLIVVGIFSSYPASDQTRETWICLDDKTLHFYITGLKKSSFIKAEKITIVHKSVLHHKIGTIPDELLREVDLALKKALKIEG